MAIRKREALAGQEALINDVHATPRKAPLFVDEQVVHDAGQPGAGLLDRDEIIELAEGLDEQLLEQVFGLGLAAREPKREAVQPVEVRPNELFECRFVPFAAHWQF